MTWPTWFTRLYEGATEDLGWPPPPLFTQLPSGQWRLERHTGWATLVTFHATYDQAVEMSQTALRTEM